MLGGLDWVVWGVFVRVAVSVTSHWVVTYFAHNPGPGRWIVRGAGVQASNLPGWGFLTHGECWHNNHHAFPESARLGIDRRSPTVSAAGSYAVAVSATWSRGLGRSARLHSVAERRKTSHMIARGYFEVYSAYTIPGCRAVLASIFAAG